MKPEQTPEETPDYASREQKLLAYLRRAEQAATTGNIAGMLEMQAKVHSILIETIGNQTQHAFQAFYAHQEDGVSKT